ncbi:MAG: LTA synthase family protein, partial [Bacteroidales bacterium]|nr:LTA synthase family protein [Bacteroidales bacterium]
MGMKPNSLALRTSWHFVINLALVYVAYYICRFAYIFENWEALKSVLTENSLSDFVVGCWKFDTSAILYTNSLYALMMLLPVHLKEKRGWQRAAKGVYLVVNGLCLAINLCDAVYFKYTGRRTTCSVFDEFANENNLGTVFGTEVVNHWYFVLLWAVMMVALWKLYRPCLCSKRWVQPLMPVGKRGFINYYITQLLCLLLFLPLCIWGMRGGIGSFVRPITISNANQYVNRPAEAAAILNTPFSLLRSMSRKSFVDPKYFDQTTLDSLYSPVHNVAPDSARVVNKRNVVVMILESFGREYLGAYNEKLEGGNYKGYTTFLDSLYEHCASFDYTFGNGRKSIDGMPSVLSSIPMFVEPFVLTSSSLCQVGGIASETGKMGYSSAFFHGAPNGSMGFLGYSRTTGFGQYFGLDEYCEDSRFGGSSDYDGTWGIWDEPFLQYYALHMGNLKEPFTSSVFTLSSHHPFAVPAKYANVYREEGNNPIHKCVRYTDNALRQFFATAQQQPWFENTIFVLVNDHCNQIDHDEYRTDLGMFGSTILF